MYAVKLLDHENALGLLNETSFAQLIDDNWKQAKLDEISKAIMQKSSVLRAVNAKDRVYVSTFGLSYIIYHPLLLLASILLLSLLPLLSDEASFFCHC